MMKKPIFFLLSAVLVGSTAACNKAPEQVSSVPGTASSPAMTLRANVPAGTTFDTDLEQEISTGKDRDQDQFTLQVKNGSVGKNPVLKNAQVQGHLEQVVKAERGKKAKLAMVFDSIKLNNGDLYPIDATLVNTQVESKTKGKFLQNAGIILVGATAGHFLGNKANFKHGGMAGGTAAAAYVLSSPGGEVVLKKGTDVKLKLKSAISSAGQ
jgi:hypothetical protein